MNSTERKSQLDSLASEFQGQVKECAARASLSEHGSSVVAIETYVAPGKEDRYFQWKRKLEATQSSFPGYKGSYLQAPVPGRDNYWSSILHFGGTDALEFWLHSEQRLALVEENVQRHYFVPLLNVLNMALAVALPLCARLWCFLILCLYLSDDKANAAQKLTFAFGRLDCLSTDYSALLLSGKLCPRLNTVNWRSLSLTERIPRREHLTKNHCYQRFRRIYEITSLV